MPTAEPTRVQLVPDSVEARAVELLGPDAAAAWSARAAAALERCVRRWGFDLVAPVCSGRSGLLWRATAASGRTVAVKVPFTGHVAHFDAQQLLADTGVGPQVVARDDTSGVLGSVWVPADPVESATLTSAGLGVVLDRLAVLRDTAPQLELVSPLPSLSSWLRQRLEGTPVDVAPGSPRPSMQERVEALALLDSMPPVGSFCHGDLNMGNVLVSATGDVWLIDARGVAGDVCYDVAVFAMKATRGLPLIDRWSFVVRAARTGGFDPDRCLAWARIANAAQV